METLKIRITSKEFEELIAMLRNLPDEPVGEHLSDDEFISYVMQELPDPDLERIDEHLDSCPECTAEMERLLEIYELWRKDPDRQRLLALKQQYSHVQQLDAETLSLLEKLQAEFAGEKCSYTRMIYEILKGGHLKDMGFPDKAIDTLGRVFQRYVEEGMVKEKTEEERKEQIYLGKEFARLLEITRPEDLFLKLPEFFKCTEWKIDKSSKGFTARTKECRFCHIVKDICSASPCEMFCINLTKAILKAVAPDTEFNVKETLWDEDECIMEVTAVA
jgi:hypothetical protein